MILSVGNNFRKKLRVENLLEYSVFETFFQSNYETVFYIYPGFQRLKNAANAAYIPKQTCS